MGSLEVPRDHLVACSDIIDKKVEYLASRSVDFRDDRAMDAALKTIQLTVPGLIEMYQEPTFVEANGIFRWHEGEVTHFSSGSFEGVLSRVSLEKVVKKEYADFLDQEIEIIRFDLGLIFRQRIAEPDPVDLGYSDEILVPMGGIETLRSAA